METDRVAAVTSTPVHPVQREVNATLVNLGGVTIDQDDCATDGCSAPTWAMPLAAMDLAFARYGSGQGMAPERAKAAARLRVACAAHPWHVAGTGRFDTEIMQAFGERVFVKTGAEGVFCGAIPEQGLGIAVKCDDGAGRAAEVMMAATLARFLKSDDDPAKLERFVRPILRNWNGIAVGVLRPTASSRGARDARITLQRHHERRQATRPRPEIEARRPSPVATRFEQVGGRHEAEHEERDRYGDRYRELAKACKHARRLLFLTIGNLDVAC